MEGGDIDRRRGRRAPEGEDVGRAREQLLAPRTDLMRVDVEALGEFGERGIALDGRERDLGLEGGAGMATGTTGLEGSGSSERKIARASRLST